MCGEKLGITPQGVTIQGSPPRVRGKAAAHILPVPSARITPACAGKRAFQKKNLCIPWDHPRVCGEKPNLAAAGGNKRGSPPRVRGKVKLQYFQF